MATLSVACGCSAFLAGAQTPIAGVPAKFAVIEGVAVDSLHHSVLRGAILLVEGADANTTTDSSGRFRFDSVPSGLRRISVVHPLLDTVGVTLITAPLQIADGQHLDLVIGTPSPQTLVALKCTPAERAAGPDAMLGLVRYAEGEEPAVGSEVTLEWTDYDVVGKGLRTTSRRSVAKVSDTGQFRLCGLPQDLSGLLRASSGRDTTSAIRVHTSSLLGIVGLELPEIGSAKSPSGPAAAAVAATTAGVGHAFVTGRVLGPDGRQIAGARLSVGSDSAFALSGADGRFALSNLRAGTRTVSVRSLGFEPADVEVNVSERNPIDITVRLGPVVPVLDPVHITAAFAQQALDRIGFTRRKKTSDGYYLTPEEIADRNETQLPFLLARAPTLRVAYYGSHAAIIAHPRGTGRGCVTYFVDGTPWLGRGIENAMSPAEVGAVEVYSAGMAPPEFTRPLQRCETVVIWTKTKLGI
ncbi:MAG TPA: carboxypeptidase-like regulatory domain-containing protein [Gemmatimonadaceae bacterium]